MKFVAHKINSKISHGTGLRLFCFPKERILPMVRQERLQIGILVMLIAAIVSGGTVLEHTTSIVLSMLISGAVLVLGILMLKVGKALTLWQITGLEMVLLGSSCFAVLLGDKDPAILISGQGMVIIGVVILIISSIAATRRQWRRSTRDRDDEQI